MFKKMMCRLVLNSIAELEKRGIKADANFIENYEKGLEEYGKILSAEEIEGYRKRLEAIKE